MYKLTPPPASPEPPPEPFDLRCDFMSFRSFSFRVGRAEDSCQFSS